MPLAMRILSALLAAALNAACAEPRVEGAPLSRREIRLTSGGAVLQTLFTDTVPEYQFVLHPTGGTQESIAAVEAGRAEIAFATADATYMAYIGRLPSLPDRARHIRAIAVLYPDTLHLLVPAGSTIGSVADLRGRRVGLGQVGGATAVSAELVLSAFGLSLHDVRGVLFPRHEIAARFRAGALDAAFATGGHPSNWVTPPAQDGARLVPLAGAQIDQMRADYPFLKVVSIAPGTYPNQPAPVLTLAVDALLLCRADLDEAVVHRLTAGLFEFLPRWAAQRSAVRRMDLQRTAATPIPLHPGAARYYRERELQQ